MNVNTLSEAMIDMTLADSFPASDPPAWTLGREVQSESSAGVAPLIDEKNDELATPLKYYVVPNLT
jgi:hypothetical protein